MYLLKQITTNEWNNTQEIIDFYNDLPNKPYCTNAKGFCHIRTKAKAIKHAYIQPNHPAVVHWLVFDIDNDNALFAYHDHNTPRPQLIIKNPHNGHAHYCYRLSEKVGIWGKSSERAVKYLDAVYNALQRKLGADRSYSGNLVKNPAHSDWQTYTTGAKKSYSLAELADYLELERPQTPQADNDSYFGRNCAVFHATRHQAYKIADKYDFNVLYREVLAIAQDENAKFNNPMQPNELHHIAKSITRYCKSPRFLAISKAWFSRLQAHRGKMGGKKSKRLPIADSERTQKPWIELGISRATYYNRKKQGKI